ncbi:MAG: IS3 family transposase [Clostridia bacterium]
MIRLKIEAISTEYYNNRRIKSNLKGMSKVKYRQHSILVA